MEFPIANPCRRDNEPGRCNIVPCPKSAQGRVLAAEKRHLLVQMHVEKALGVYVVDGAAAALGVKPSTLRYRMRKLGISRADLR